VKGRLWAITIASLAFAYIEAAVVVYLRQLYYPEGFHFPLVSLELPLLAVEVGRETATLILLAVLAWLAGRNFIARFAAFILAFGVWDLGYYAWLKIFLNWPTSLLDWDILFLIPLPWVGPVLSPLLVSLALVIAGILLTPFGEQTQPPSFPKKAWLVESGVGLVIFMTYLWNTPAILAGGKPTQYPWMIFLVAYGTAWAVFLSEWQKVKQSLQNGE